MKAGIGITLGINGVLIVALFMTRADLDQLQERLGRIERANSKAPTLETVTRLETRLQMVVERVQANRAEREPAQQSPIVTAPSSLVSNIIIPEEGVTPGADIDGLSAWRQQLGLSYSQSDALFHYFVEFERFVGRFEWPEGENAREQIERNNAQIFAAFDELYSKVGPYLNAEQQRRLLEKRKYIGWSLPE